MKTNERGFTLIETLAAIVVLTIGIFGLYSLQVMSVRGNSIATSLTEASNLNALRMERLLGGKFDKNAKEDGLRVKRDDNSTCWFWGKTPMAAADALEDCLAKGSTWKFKDKADHAYYLPREKAKDTRYYVAYNVAAHYPVHGLKTIRMHVFTTFRSEKDSGLKPITYELIRNDPDRDLDDKAKKHPDYY